MRFVILASLIFNMTYAHASTSSSQAALNQRSQDQALVVILRNTATGEPICVAPASQELTPKYINSNHPLSSQETANLGIPMCNEQQEKALQSLARAAVPQSEAKTAALGGLILGYLAVCTVANVVTIGGLSSFGRGANEGPSQKIITTIGSHIADALLKLSVVGEIMVGGSMLLSTTVCIPVGFAEATVISGIDMVIVGLKK